MGALMVFAGPLDWWCGFRGKWFPVEVKNTEGRNRYTEAQKNFIKQCAFDHLPVWTWRTLEDVVRDLSAL
jgi:hypothetical protein